MPFQRNVCALSSAERRQAEVGPHALRCLIGRIVIMRDRRIYAVSQVGIAECVGLCK